MATPCSHRKMKNPIIFLDLESRVVCDNEICSTLLKKNFMILFFTKIEVVVFEHFIHELTFINLLMQVITLIIIQLRFDRFELCERRV